MARSLIRPAAWALLIALAVMALASTALARHGQSGRNRGGAIITCLEFQDPCLGTNRSDIINANPFAPPDTVVDGRGGNDIINGVGELHILKGGRGNNIINGGGGDDIDARNRRVDVINCQPGDWIIDADPEDIIIGDCDF